MQLHWHTVVRRGAGPLETVEITLHILPEAYRFRSVVVLIMHGQ